jgi:hypothetical protein
MHFYSATVNIITDVFQALLCKIHSKVEGVREDVRNGRERLITDAVSDLMRMRSEKYVYQYTSLLKSFS